MSQPTVETVLSAHRIDVDDRAHVTAECAHHSIAESKMRAMIDVFGPLSDSLEVYVTN